MKTVREMQHITPLYVHYGRIRQEAARPTAFALRGELGFRLWRAAHRIEDELPYSQEYILSQVSAVEGQWSNFPRFHGDIAGRWVLAETYLHANQQQPPDDLRDIMARLIALQNADGSFGKIGSDDVPLNMHKIYGNGWMLKALAQYALTFQDEAARQAALRLGEFYEQSFPLWSAARQAQTKTDYYAVSVNAYYHALDALLTLHDLTQDVRWLALASRWLPDLLTLAEADHSHMYLTIRRGLLRYYQRLDDRQAIAALAEELHTCYRDCLLETGGVPERFWLAAGEWSDDEGCSLFDWNILTTHLYELTGDTLWLRCAILNLENHIYYNQTYNGGFGSYELHAGCYKQHGKEAPWCCSLFAPYGLLETASVWVRLQQGVLEINHLVAGEFTFANGDQVTLTRDDETERFSIDLRAAPSVRRVAIHAPFWVQFSGVNGQLVENRFMIEAAQTLVQLTYTYKVWLSHKGKAPERLTTIPVDAPFVLFYGPWLLCHRFHGKPIKVHLALDKSGFVVNARRHFLLGISHYGESHRIVLPCEAHLNAEDAAGGVDEHSGQLYLYPLKDKESPGHGISAVWGK